MNLLYKISILPVCIFPFLLWFWSILTGKTRKMVVLDKASVKSSLKTLQDAKKELERDDLKGSAKHGALLKFFSETAGAKLEAVEKYLLDRLEDGDKILVFAHHQVMLDHLCKSCQMSGYKFVRIDGSTSAATRKKYCDVFQKDSDIRVALLSITAANTGLTLTAAQLVIFAELFWNPGSLVQAEDRAHRVGQECDVRVEYLVARGTCDDTVWPMIEKKLGILSNAGLSVEDFKEADRTIIFDESFCNDTAESIHQ